MPPTASADNDKISFNSHEYDLVDGRTSPVSVLEDGTYNSHFTVVEKSPSRNTERARLNLRFSRFSAYQATRPSAGGYHRHGPPTVSWVDRSISHLANVGSLRSPPCMIPYSWRSTTSFRSGVATSACG